MLAQLVGCNERVTANRCWKWTGWRRQVKAMNELQERLKKKSQSKIGIDDEKWNGLVECSTVPKNSH